MKIIDLDNKVIEVTDLDKAIEQAEEFVSYDGSEQLNRYWQYMLLQLKHLKTTIQ